MIGVVPPDCPPQLRQFLEAQFAQYEADVRTAVQLDVLTALPLKPIKGKIYYFDNVIGATITTSGFWGYKGNNVWTLLG